MNYVIFLALAECLSPLRCVSGRSITVTTVTSFVGGWAGGWWPAECAADADADYDPSNSNAMRVGGVMKIIIDPEEGRGPLWATRGERTSRGRGMRV